MANLEKVIVINNARGLLQFEVALGGNDRRMVQLNPGANAVDAHLWKEGKKLATVGIWMKTKALAEDAPAGSFMVEETKGLPALNADKADKLLRATFDKALLVTWAQTETRDEIKELIVARQDEMERIAKDATAESRQKNAATR